MTKTKMILIHFFGVIILTVLVGGFTWFSMNNKLKQANKNSSDLTSEKSDLQQQLGLAAEESNGAPFAENIDDTAWKTFSNTNLGVSFKYPTDWTLSDYSSVYPDSNNLISVRVEPTHYYDSMKNTITAKDGTSPAGVSVNCDKNTDESDQTISDDLKNGRATDYRTTVIGSNGLKAKYYVRLPLFSSKVFFVSNSDNTVHCQISEPTLASSPLTKFEDQEGEYVINTFGFTK